MAVPVRLTDFLEEPGSGRSEVPEIATGIAMNPGLGFRCSHTPEDGSCTWSCCLGLLASLAQSVHFLLVPVDRKHQTVHHWLAFFYSQSPIFQFISLVLRKEFEIGSSFFHRQI